MKKQSILVPLQSNKIALSRVGKEKKERKKEQEEEEEEKEEEEEDRTLLRCPLPLLLFFFLCFSLPSLHSAILLL